MLTLFMTSLIQTSRAQNHNFATFSHKFLMQQDEKQSEKLLCVCLFIIQFLSIEALMLLQLSSHRVFLRHILPSTCLNVTIGFSITWFSVHWQGKLIKKITAPPCQHDGLSFSIFSDFLLSFFIFQGEMASTLNLQFLWVLMISLSFLCCLLFDKIYMLWILVQSEFWCFAA